MNIENIEITDTAYGGSGVGKSANGKVVFIPYTVTGDIVKAELTEDKGSYTLAKCVEIVHSSEHRVAPDCEYYGVCGGCQFGHISYAYQLELKKHFLLNSLRKYKGILPEIKVFESAHENYRIRATLRAAGDSLGFYKFGSNELLPIKSCKVLSDKLFDSASAWVKEFAPDGAYSISLLETPDEAVYAMVTGHGVENYSSPAPFAGVKLVDIDQNEKWKIIGEQSISYETASGKVPVAYGGFFQANRYLIDAFQSYAVSLVPAGSNVLELYAGAGFFTKPLSDNINIPRVMGLEISGEAVKLGQGAGLPIRKADLGQPFKVKFKYDSIFVDPPRDGLSKNVIAKILADKPLNIVYVSCNPTTLGRDIMRLADVYKVESIAIFDMYPDTYHVETVVKLTIK